MFVDAVTLGVVEIKMSYDDIQFGQIFCHMIPAITIAVNIVHFVRDVPFANILFEEITA